MKKILLFCVPFMLSTHLWAERITDNVHSFSEGKKGESHLLFLKNGRVIFVDPSFSANEFVSGEKVEVEVNNKNQLEGISTLDEARDMDVEAPFTSLAVTEKATVLPSYARANAIFRGMNRSYRQNSECTDRAHIWSYEEWRKHGLVTNKMFMFFTNTYIRRYNYHWWFHATPYTFVGSTEYMMDRRYTSAPRTRKVWSDIFIRSKKSCPVTTYAHYRRNKNSPEHCFHVKSNMYNRLPYHVRMQEDYGRVQSRFNTSEINFSYRAFTRRGLNR